MPRYKGSTIRQGRGQPKDLPDPGLGWALLSGGWVYQFGSGWRKQQQGKIDTVGMDCFDYALGYLITATARKLWQ